jgi:hypothetical protein
VNLCPVLPSALGVLVYRRRHGGRSAQGPAEARANPLAVAGLVTGR